MGKHDIDRVCQGLRDSLKALCVICLVLAVAVFASRRLLLSIFLDPATDAASIAQGADFLSVMGFAYIIAAVMNSYLNVLRGAGDVNVSLVAGLFEMGARLAFASLLAPHLGVGHLACYPVKLGFRLYHPGDAVLQQRMDEANADLNR